MSRTQIYIAENELRIIPATGSHYAFKNGICLIIKSSYDTGTYSIATSLPNGGDYRIQANGSDGVVTVELSTGFLNKISTGRAMQLYLPVMAEYNYNVSDGALVFIGFDPSPITLQNYTYRA